MENNIQNRYENQINMNNDINIKKDNQTENNNNKNNDTPNGQIEEENINKKIKYRINFSVLIHELRNISDVIEERSQVEYNTNLLLMSSEINQSNKISCLTLLSFINHKFNNALYTYYINKKIFKYLKIQKGIESFIYIRTLYRAAFFLEKDKNYFYAYKYAEEANSLCKNSKIDDKSEKMLNELKQSIADGINDYVKISIKKFQETDKKNNLNKENYNRLKALIRSLIGNKYEIENDENNKNNDEYLYLINRKWVVKANDFLEDYTNNVRKKDYFKKAFEPNYLYYNYFNDKIEEKIKEEYKYNPYPCHIDNYSISDWTDNLYDPLNEDENNYLQSNVLYIKDYFLLEKSDFLFLKSFFGVTNIIKRKKEYLNFVFIKGIIFDKRYKKKNTNFLLRIRNFQIRKNSTISDFKEKILRCVKNNIKEILKSKKDKKENDKLYFVLLFLLHYF